MLSLTWLLLLAFGLRLSAALGISWFALRTNGSTLWLDDEAAYHYASVAVATSGLFTPLPEQLRHLGGNGYLGLTSLVYAAFGPYPILLRGINALLGTCAVWLVYLVAQRAFGRRAARCATLLAACYPPLILWSATLLRESLVMVAVLSVWLGLQAWQGRERWLGSVQIFFSFWLLGSLRFYVLVAAVLAVLAGHLVPRVRRRYREAALPSLALLAVVLGTVWVRGDLVDRLARDWTYKQSIVRLEAFRSLYPPGQPESQRFGRGAVVAWVDGASTNVGVIWEHWGATAELVALQDGTRQVIERSRLTPVAEYRFSLAYPTISALPNAVAIVTGTGVMPEDGWPRFAWIVDSLVWSMLLVASLAGLATRRLRFSAAAYPLLVALATASVLMLIPSAPANAARHKASQTVPGLLVLVSALLVGDAFRLTSRDERTMPTVPSTSPASASTALASRNPSGR